MTDELKAPFLALMKGRNGYRVKQVGKSPFGMAWYNLVKDGERFPLAGGSISDMMKTWAAI